MSCQEHKEIQSLLTKTTIDLLYHAKMTQHFIIKPHYLFNISEEEREPLIWILDSSYHYCNEFYGADPGVALTPVTDRCFLTMSQALSNVQGSHLCGPGGVGKTETVKVSTLCFT
jgi:GTPase SAR1 family protein